MNKNKIKKMAVLLNETFYPILKESIRGKVSKEDGLNIAVALLSNLDDNQGIEKLMKEACENTNNMIKENFLLSVHHASNIKENLFRENVLEVVKAVKADRVEDIVTERFEALKNINLAHAPEEGDELTPDVGTGEADDATTVDGEDFSGNVGAMEEELGIDEFAVEDEGVTGEAGDFDEMGLGGDSADIFGTDSTAGEDDEFSFEGEGDDTVEGSDDEFSFEDDSTTEDTEEATEDEIHKESIRRFRESVVYLKNVKSLAGGNTQAMVSAIGTHATEEGSDVVATVANESAEGKVTSIVKTAINTIQTYLRTSNTKDLDVIGELTLVAKLLGHAINNVMEEGVNNLYVNERGMLKTALDEIDATGAKYSIARGYLGLYSQILEEKIGIDEDVVFNNAAENHIVQSSPVGGDIAVSYVLAETDNFHKHAGEDEGLVSIDDIVATKESFKNYLNDELSYMGDGAPVELRNLIGQIMLAVDVSTEEILSAIIVSFGNVINYTTEERKALREIILTTLTYCHATGRGLDTLLEGDNEIATKIMSVLYLTVDPSESAVVKEEPMGDSQVVQNTTIPTDKLEDVVDDTIEADANETNLIKEAATYKIDPNLVTYEEIEGMVNTLESNPKAFYTDEELKTYGTELNDIYGKVISGGQPIFKKLKALDFGRRCVDMLKPSSKLGDAIQTRLSSGKNPVTRLSSLTDDVLKYASRSGLIALSMLAPVAGIAVATFAIVARMLSQRERETTRKVINHEIAKLNVAKSMAKDKEVEEYLDTIISHYTKILQYVEGNYNANKEISGIRKAVESLLKRNRKDGRKLIKESRLNRLVAKSSATQLYRECCLTSMLSNYDSIFKGIVEAALKGEISGKESIEAITNSLTDSTKSYIRLVEYKLSLEPNEEANSLMLKIVDLLCKEGVGQNDFANFILSDMHLTSDASAYRGLMAIPFAYLAMFVTAEEGVTVDKDVIAQHLADLEYLDTAKAYAVQVIASLSGNENALKYSSFDLYNLESPKAETADSEVAQSDLYEEASKVPLNKVVIEDDSKCVKAMSDVSSDMIKAIKDIAEGHIEPYKLGGKVVEKLKRMQGILDSGAGMNDTKTMAGFNRFSFREVTGIDYLKRFLSGALPIIDIVRTKKSLDAETEKKLLNLIDPLLSEAGFFGKLTMATAGMGAILKADKSMQGLNKQGIAGLIGSIALLSLIITKDVATKRRVESYHRVLPKTIVKVKALSKQKGISEEDRLMYELILIHLYITAGYIIEDGMLLDEMKEEYGMSNLTQLDKIVDKKFKELAALAEVSNKFKEAPHAMGDITVNKQLRGIKKLNNETIEMLKDIAAGNVDKYRLDEKLKAQLKKFYSNAAYLDGEVKGTALITGLGPKFEKPVSSFSKKLLEFIGGAFPIIDAFRSQASMEKEIEEKLLKMINPIQSLARNMGTLTLGTAGYVINATTQQAGAKDAGRLSANTPMKNPVLTGLWLANAGALMLFLVGSAASSSKRRKGLVNVCERLEYKFKALSQSKKIPKEEKSMYELMLMHVMLVHKYIDPEQYSNKGLPEYAVNLEDEINEKFDEIIKSVGIEKSFKEAAGMSVRLIRENRVLSKLAKLNGFKESVSGDIEYIGDGATEAILDILDMEPHDDEVTIGETETTEDVLGDTFEDVTELVVEEPSEPVAMVATTITENIAEGEVGGIYSETAKASFVTSLDFVDANGKVNEDAIIEGIKKVKNSVADKLQAKHTKKYVALVEGIGRDMMGESRKEMDNIGLDTLLSASPRSVMVRQQYYGALTEELVNSFGGVLHTNGSFEYACLLAFNTPIKMAILNKRMAHDKEAVTRVIADALAGIDSYINDTLGGSRFKTLPSAKKNILTDVRATISQGISASTYKEGIDRDYSPAIAAISTYAIGLDTLLNEKGNSKEFIASMLRK